MVEIVAGLRFDSFKLDVDDLRTAADAFQPQRQLWSPRLGLILKPRDNLSLYASYSRSYLPQSGDQFSGLDSTHRSAEARAVRQLRNRRQMGADRRPAGHRRPLPARPHQHPRADPATQLTVLTGAQRSRGLELGLERSVTDRWQISAGYALQEAEITETTTAAPAGREVPLVPRHSFSLWNRYDVIEALGLGLGLIARTKSYASISNAGEAARLCARRRGALLQLPRGVEAQVNVENLLRRRLFPDRPQRQ